MLMDAPGEVAALADRRATPRRLPHQRRVPDSVNAMDTSGPHAESRHFLSRGFVWEAGTHAQNKRRKLNRVG